MTPFPSLRGPWALALAALAAGGLALAALALFTSSGRAGGQVREYWVAAVPVDWHVVPNERNAIEGEMFHADETTFRTGRLPAFHPRLGEDDPERGG